MSRTWTVAVVLVIVMGWSRAASAQDERVGLTMGYPTAVGVLWQVSDRLAIRPEFSWGHQSTDRGDDGFAPSTSDSSDFSVAISGLVRLRQWGPVRSYVAPRFEAARIAFETTYEFAFFPPGFPSGQSTSETTTTTFTTYEGGASIGVQASPAAHFGIFGEVGMMYTRSKTSSSSLLDPSSSPTRGHGVGIRSAVGVILFF